MTIVQDLYKILLFKKTHRKTGAFMENNSNIIEMKCSYCGGQIQIPAHLNGKVKCPWCDSEIFIEGLVKNTEILNKENINSAVPIALDQKALNTHIVTALTTPLATFPLDILEKCTITELKHICVPAYLFYCNGMASYTCEIGIEKERTTSQEVNGRIEYVTETYTDWHPVSGTATTSGCVIVSGNREFRRIVNHLYDSYNISKLIDVESIDFPKDINAFGFDFPQPAAFNEYVTPRMKEMLLSSAEDILSRKDYQNLELGGFNIQKNEVLRLLLGIYQVSIKYNNNIYMLYVNGDGSNYYWNWNSHPIDKTREQIYQEKKSAEKKQENSTYLFLAIVFGICALFTFGITLIPAGIFGYLHYKRTNKLKSTKAEIDALLAEGKNVRDHFLQSGQFINGL